MFARETWRPHNISHLYWGVPQWRHEEDGRQLELTVRSPYENLCSSIMHSYLDTAPDNRCIVCGAVV